MKKNQGFTLIELLIVIFGRHYFCRR
ncbi:MAG: type II secretion system protein [Candidatus Buchananbacteria bacterium]|nr:type II secretion system protein [Candidatus Buchananbacteria bacterium]